MVLRCTIVIREICKENLGTLETWVSKSTKEVTGYKVCATPLSELFNFLRTQLLWVLKVHSI